MCVFPQKGVTRITASSLEHPGHAFQSIRQLNQVSVFIVSACATISHPSADTLPPVIKKKFTSLWHFRISNSRPDSHSHDDALQLNSEFVAFEFVSKK
jgi:hypothetical protein